MPQVVLIAACPFPPAPACRSRRSPFSSSPSPHPSPQPGFRVEIDKGLKRSLTDDCFVCQKKNHFQATVACKMQSQPAYVATRSGLLKVSGLYINMYGIKAEAPAKHVRLEQSQPDRSKKSFAPAPIAVLSNEVTKVTIGRLHFAETTHNNMRKKGKPNPDQRYFALIVTLAARAGDELYTIASHRSENMIVRASNPGQFESEPNVQWVKGQTINSIYHSGAVGINIDTPDEALCVRGNIRLSGAILQPSDRRVKRDIERANTQEQVCRLKRHVLSLARQATSPVLSHNVLLYSTACPTPSPPPSHHLSQPSWRRSCGCRSTSTA